MNANKCKKLLHIFSWAFIIIGYSFIFICLNQGKVQAQAGSQAQSQTYETYQEENAALVSSLSSAKIKNRLENLRLNINEKDYYRLPKHLQFEDLFELHLKKKQIYHNKGFVSGPGSILEYNSESCPCKDATLCNPVTIENKKEIFGFMGGKYDNYKWRFYDWDLLTTLCWPPQSALPDLVCHAHENKVRILANAYGPPLTSNLTARAEWIKSSMIDVISHSYDGLVFDFEDPLDYRAPENIYYIDLVRETREVLRTYYSPSSKTAVCLSWNPFGVDGRYYNNKGLSDVSDFSYIMNYDTRSQIVDRCTASANAPLFSTIKGLNQYLEIGLDKDKIILGVPWYGYNYPCLQREGDTDLRTFDSFIQDREGECMLKEIPFRGINCSDAAGGQVAYEFIMQKKALFPRTPNKKYDDFHTDNILYVTSHWDNYTHSPYLNVYTATDIDANRGLDISKTGSGSHSYIRNQIWYDNPESLRYKYQVAKELGIRGVGPFTFDKLDYTGNDTKRFVEGPREAKEMWNSFKTFLSSN